MHIDKYVPFGEIIYRRLQLLCQANLQSIIRHSECYEEHYLAWEEVRKGINPFFVNGTGFEGYFVGLCTKPEETLERLLRLGHEMLTNLLRLHPFEQRFRANLMKTLTSQRNDPKAIDEWSAEFGAALARLRCNVIHNRQAEAFREHTYQLVYALAPIQYDISCETIRQHFTIYRCSAQTSRLVVEPDLLKDQDQEAWLVVEAIGKFGHPLVREFLRRNYGLVRLAH